MCGGGGKGQGGYTPQGGPWGNLTPAQQQTVTASPQAVSWYQQAMSQAQQAASQPFQQYGTQASDFVAQLNPTQQSAISNISGMQGMTDPYYQAATGTLGQALTPTYQTVGQYMNPFMNQVVSPVQQALQQQQGQQLAGQQSEAIRGGAFGGERAGLQRDVLRGQQNLAMGQAISPLYQTGYGQALQAAQQQQQAGLQGANLYGQLGTGAQQAALAQAGAQLGAGTLGQQTEQAGKTALYNQFQQQRAYPFQTAQFLSGIAGGLGPLMGQMTYQSQATNPFGQFLARGGAAKSRMGGAVREAGDYADGGVVGRDGYKLRGSVTSDEDISSILAAQEGMYQDENKPTGTEIPTSGIQTGKGLEGAKFGSLPEEKSITDKIKALTGAAKDVVGMGKDVYGLGKGAYDYLNSGSPGLSKWLSGVGSTTAQTAPLDLAGATSGGGFLDAIGSGLSGLGSAFMSGLETLGPALALLKDGGRVGYDDGGVVDDDIETYLRPLAKGETGGEKDPYAALGPLSRRGDRAYGKYQIMGENIPKWSREAGLGALTPEEFLSNPKSQEAIARAKFGEYLKRTGSPEEAAAMWFAGPGYKSHPGAKDVLGTSIPKYMETYRKNLGSDDQGLSAILSRVTPEQREFVATADLPRRSSSEETGESGVNPSEEEGLGLNRQTIIPALTGLGAALEGMVTSPTVGLGGALLRGAGAGLGAGAKSYMEVGKQIPEIEKLKAEALRIGAETGRIGSETRAKDIENFQKSFLDTPYGRVVFLANGMPINQSEYRERIARGERVPLLGALPSDAEERAARVFTQPGATAGPSDTELPEEGTTVSVKQPPLPKVSVKPPEVKTPETPGVVYDNSSRERAKREQDVAMDGGPRAEMAKQNTDTYNKMVTNEAIGARENAPYMKELATTLADSYTKGGFNTPGFKSELRAEVISAANTFYHALGGEGDLGTLKKDQDIVNKISTLLSSDRARAGNQHAYAALETMKNAIPNLSMDPRAGAELTAQLMVLQQRALDRNDHMKKYAKDSNGYLNEAAEDFTDKSTSRYQMESKIISDLMLRRAGALKMMMAGHGLTPDQIETKLKQWYGKDTPDGMWRYFAPERR